MTSAGPLALLGLLAALLPDPALAKKLAPGEQVDLNRATTAELQRLPGVGRKRADAIVAARAQKPFRRPEDVLRVKGLSRAWFERVKGHLAAGPPPPASASPVRR
ncbi:MAG TPA: helix-hairpin-helix domain-containing protein [Anaeromyxobacteraceae bacterium]|nr:helix-hairpin-helix domain-containing protein [Anaeromyxobacteraceae bacterium]